jgi:hypothetical protein
MIAAAATVVSTSSGDIPPNRASAAASGKSSRVTEGWMARAIANLKEFAPYAVLELVLPGGSLMAILLWLYRRRMSRRGVSLPRSRLRTPFHGPDEC